MGVIQILKDTEIGDGKYKDDGRAGDMYIHLPSPMYIVERENGIDEEDDERYFLSMIMFLLKTHTPQTLPQIARIEINYFTIAERSDHLCGCSRR